MESREGMNSGVTVIGADDPSSYHLAPRTENSTAITGVPSQAIVTIAATSVNAGSTEKKKRGRPRKYAPDAPGAGGSRPLSPMPISSAAPPVTGNYLADNNASGGRPYSSEKKQKPKVENFGNLEVYGRVFYIISICEFVYLDCLAILQHFA